MQAIGAVLACVAWLGCSSERAQSSAHAPDARVPSISAIELSANSYWSFGHDWWRVVFRRDLTCTWSGRLQTQRIGEFRGTLEPRQWEQLVASIEALKIGRLLPHYDDPDAHDCEHIVLTVHHGSDSTSVDNYNSAGPDELWQAQMAILGLSDMVGWAEVKQ